MKRGYISQQELEVLIDTWWNVNQQYHIQEMLTQLVLIDTWWNVNTLTVSVMPDSIKVLIDTWWNVNMYKSCHRVNIS